MRELVIHPNQTADQEALIDEVVERLDAVDLALGDYLARCAGSAGSTGVRGHRPRPLSPRSYRARIAEWCRDPAVRAAFGTEAVVSTALAVPHLTDEELLVFVHDLIDRASAAAIRPARRRFRRRAVVAHARSGRRCARSFSVLVPR